jgi:hypothetical protein
MDEELVDGVDGSSDSTFFPSYKSGKEPHCTTSAGEPPVSHSSTPVSYFIEELNKFGKKCSQLE